MWEAAKTASAGKHACPMCDRADGRTVTIGVDADESTGGPNDMTGTPSSVTLDVCRDDQFIWFDPGELDQLPEDPPPTRSRPPPRSAAIDRITTAYERELGAAYEDDSHLGRFADRRWPSATPAS